MTEGTKSVLFGCHNPLIHGIFVLMAWRLEYKLLPKWWEIICIFLHDIGLWGRQYLSDDFAKKGHWKLGASMAWDIVWLLSKDFEKAADAYALVAGHASSESFFPESMLSRADKRAHLVTPTWILWISYFVEWHGRGFGVTKPNEWKRLVAENLRQTDPIDSHELYIKNRNGKKEGLWEHTAEQQAMANTM